MTQLREMQVDWAGLHGAFQINVPQIRCFLRLADGAVLKLSPGDPGLAATATNPSDHLPIEATPPRIQYQWLDTFIQTVEDHDLRAKLSVAINGKGAFRRFKDILLDLPDERRHWFEFRDEKMRERIIEWVREQGIEPVNAPNWEAPAPGATSSNVAATGSSARDCQALRDYLIVSAQAWELAELPPGKWEEIAEAMCDNFWVTER